LLAAIQQRSSSPEIGYYDCLEPTWVFYSGHALTNVATSRDPARMTPELAPAGPRKWEARPRTPLREFFTSSDRFLITTRAAWEEAKAEAPADAVVVAEAPYFMRKGDLVVVARVPGGLTASRGGGRR
jgi:hypothetical protein